MPTPSIRKAQATPAVPPATAPKAAAAPEPQGSFGRDGFRYESAMNLLTERKIRQPKGKEMPTRHIERDGLEQTGWLWGKRKAAAKKLIAKNAPLVEKRLASFTPAQQAQYRAVEKLVGKIDPASTLALQSLMLSNPPKMPGNQPNLDGENMLAALGRLADPKTKIHPSIDRHQLLRQLVREVADPAATDQAEWGTCTVTSLEIITAKTDPAEYVRIVGGLASPQGEVKLRGGDTLKREKGTEQARGRKLTEDGETFHIPDFRSVPTRLWAAAFMELGNGDDRYDNNTDTHLPSGESGLADEQVDNVTRAVTGQRYVTLYPPTEDAPFTPDDPVIRKLREVTAAGTPVSVGMRWGEPDEFGKVHDGHEVVFTGFQGDKVKILNPWGLEETIGLEAFLERCDAIHLPEDQAPPPIDPAPEIPV